MCWCNIYNIQHGFPVLIVGTIDKSKKFYPFGICCNEKEEAFQFIFSSVKDSVCEIYKVDYEHTILVADASDAITNGLKAVFEQLTLMKSKMLQKDVGHRKFQKLYR